MTMPSKIWAMERKDAEIARLTAALEMQDKLWSKTTTTLRAEREAALKEQDRLAKAWHAKHEEEVRKSKDHDDYFDKSQRRMHELAAERDAAFAAGKLVEAGSELQRLWSIGSGGRDLSWRIALEQGMEEHAFALTAYRAAFDKLVAERVSAELTKRGGTVDDNSLKQSLNEIGNQIHNISCEHQDNEALADRLTDLRGRIWSLAKDVHTMRAPTSTVTVKPLSVAAVVNIIKENLSGPMFQEPEIQAAHEKDLEETARLILAAFSPTADQEGGAA